MSYLPSIKVALLDNISWSNGSRVKPLNPITVDLIAQFEEKKDHKINWINDEIGLIVLAGDFNYLVYKETEFYTLTKSRIIDAEKLIFVYTVTKDHWQNFINNPNNSIKGCLIKTNDTSVLWSNIQYTKAAVLNANYEQLFLTKTDTSDTGELSNFLNIKPFEKQEGKITQFKTRRIVKSEFEAFRNKLTANYAGITKTPNQIYSYCPIRNVPGWKNYIAELVEKFLTSIEDNNPLFLGILDDVSHTSPALNTYLHNVNNGAKKYILAKKLHHITDKNPTKEEQKIIRDFDLTKIDGIDLIDTQNLQPKSLGNKNITDFYEDSAYKGIEKNNKTWVLKNKMFSPVTDPTHYSYLNVHSKAFKENYTIVNKKLEDINLKSLSNEYKEHKYDFTENNVPALYYVDWSETISNSTLKNIIWNNDYSTEMGFLLYKISNFKKTCYPDITNKFLYNGNPIFLTTGIRTPPEYLTCSTVRKLSDETIVREEKRALFGDIYRNEVNKSVWLTIWTAYLWKGDLDRIFEGLSPDNLQNQFSYTVAQCYVDENGEVFDSAKQSQTEEEKQEKLPTWGVSPFKPTENNEAFKKAMQELTDRRRKIEINTQLYHPFIDVGDIYWNTAQHGYFSDEELIFDEPCLVVFGDTNYSYFNKSRNQTVYSLKDKGSYYGYKLGVLSMWQPSDFPINSDNLIVQNKETPKIGTIDTLLTEYPQEGTYDYEKFKNAWISYLDNPNRRSSSWDYIYFWEENLGYIKHGHIRFWYDWPQYNGKMDYVIGCTQEKPNLFAQAWGAKQKVVLQFEHSIKRVYLYTEHNRMEALNNHIAYYINSYLVKKRFLKDTSSYSLTSWTNTQQVNQNLTNNLSKLLTEVYQKGNVEKVENNRITHIDENELKKHTSTPLLFVFKTGDKPVFYATISWNNTQKKPIVTIYLADLSLLINEPLKQIKLIKQPNLYTGNITQVINQRNFLYVHGDTMELQTKIIGGDIDKNFNLRVQNINIGDTAASHYRALFESEIEVIKKYISKPKFAVSGAAGILSNKEKLEYKIQQEYRQKTENLERELHKENERLANQNLRNQAEDLTWDKQNFYIQSTLNTVGSLAGGLASAATTGTLNPVAALSIGTSLSGNISNMYQQSHQLDIRARNLQQADVDSAFKISHAKKTMDERHKNDEMREKLQLYKITNNVTNKIPNQADILAEIEKFDGITNSICIYNRIPSGKLLDYLEQYHENYGYDLTVNNFELSVQQIIKNPPKTIYQFLRIDNITISNLVDYEQIKACFLNGIYLVDFTYKLIHISYLELQRKHKEKVAAAKAKVLAAEKAQRQKELEEITAAEKGKELAKTDYKEKTEGFDKCEEDLNTVKKELEKTKTKIQELNEQILAYQANDNKTKEDYEVKIQQITKEREGAECDKTALEQKIKELEESNDLLIQALALTPTEEDALEHVEAVDKEIKQVREQKAELERQLAAEKEACKDYTECQKEKTNINNLYQSLLKEWVAYKLEIARLTQENQQIKEQKASDDTALEKVREELKTRNDELSRCMTEKEELKKQDAGEAGEITRLKNLYEALAKKKTRLADLRKWYAIYWRNIKSYMEYKHDGDGSYNYFTMCNKNWYVSSYRLYLSNGYISLEQRSDSADICRFNWNTENSNNQNYPLIPKHLNIHRDKIYRKDSYEGFSFYSSGYYLEFYINSGITYMPGQNEGVGDSQYGYNTVVKKFREIGNNVFVYSSSIWNLKNEIAQHIRANREMFANPNDAENTALEWEQLTY